MNTVAESNYNFDAFISYCREPDLRLAKALRRHLQQFAKPRLLSLRALKVFVDESLPPGSTVTARLAETLAKSRCLILLASPRAAASHWVNLEVQTWLECNPKHSLEQLIVVLTDGDIVWNTAESAGCDRKETTALPAHLLDAYESCPAYVDLKAWRDWDRKNSLRLSNRRYEEIVAAISGAVQAKDPDDLVGVEQKYKNRLVTILSALTAAALLLALATGWFAWREGIQAEAARQGRFQAALNDFKQQDELVHRYVGNYAAAIERQDLPASLAWATKALQTDREKPLWKEVDGLEDLLPDWKQRRRLHALRMDSLMRQYPRLEQSMFLGSPVKHVKFLGNGSQLLTIDDQRAAVWDIATGRCLHDGMSLSGSPNAWSVSPNSTYLAMAASRPGSPLEFRVWSLTRGELVAYNGELQGMPQEILFSPDEKQIAIRSSQSGGSAMAAGYSAMDDSLVSEIRSFSLPALTSIHDWRSSVLVSQMAFHPDGKHLVWVGTDLRPRAGGPEDPEQAQSFSIADLDSGQIEMPEDDHGSSGYSSVAVNERGNLLAMGNSRGQISFWDFADKKSREGTLQSSGKITHLRFQGSRLLVQNDAQIGLAGIPVTGGEWSVWDLASINPNAAGSTRRLLQQVLQETTIEHTVFAAGGEFVVVCTDNGEARLWDINRGRRGAPTLPHAGPVTHAAFASDSSQLATAGEDGQVRVWALATASKANLELNGTPGIPVDFSLSESSRLAAVSPDGQTLLELLPTDDLGTTPAGSEGSNRLRLRRVDSNKPSQTEWLLERPVSHAVFSPSGDYLAVGSNSSMKSFANQPGAELDLSNLDLSDAEELQRKVREMLQPGAADSVVRDVVFLRPVSSGAKPLRLEHTGTVLKIGFSPDSTLLLAAGTSNNSMQGAISIWDSATGEAFCPACQISLGPIDDFQLSEDSHRLWARSQVGTVHTWELQRDTPPKALGDLFETFDASCMSNDGKYVATASGQQIMIRDASTHAPIGDAFDHDEAVQILRFVPAAETTNARQTDPDRIPYLVAAGSRVARVWDVQSAKPIGAAIREQEIVAAQISTGGQMIATVNGADGTVHVWELETGLPITPPIHERDIPLAKSLFQNGYSELRFVSGPDRLRLKTTYDFSEWSLESPEFNADELMLKTEVLTCRTISDLEGLGVGTIETADSESHLNYLLASKDYGDKPTIYLQRARLNARNRKWTDAIRDVETGIRRGAPMLEAKRLLATYHDQQMRFDLSLPIWKWIAEQRPLDIIARRSLANSLYMVGRANEGVEVLMDLWRNPDATFFEKAQADFLLSGFRGTAAAESGNWEDARQCWQEINQSGDVMLVKADFGTRYYIALSHLVEGNRDQFREEAQAICTEAQVRPSPSDWYWGVWICCLTPDAQNDWSDVIKLAQASAKSRKENRNGILGAAMLRDGKWDEAIKFLKAEESDVARVATEEQVAYRGHPPVYNWLFLALAQAHKRKKAEARSWIKKADDWVAQQQQSPVIIPWNRRITIETLRAEVEQLLR